MKTGREEYPRLEALNGNLTAIKENIKGTNKGTPEERSDHRTCPTCGASTVRGGKTTR